MTQDQESSIAERFQTEHQITTIETKLNPSLLGGLKVTIGDVVYDSSVENKIEQLSESIRNF